MPVIASLPLHCHKKKHPRKTHCGSDNSIEQSDHALLKRLEIFLTYASKRVSNVCSSSRRIPSNSVGSRLGCFTCCSLCCILFPNFAQRQWSDRPCMSKPRNPLGGWVAMAAAAVRSSSRSNIKSSRQIRPENLWPHRPQSPQGFCSSGLSLAPEEVPGYDSSIKGPWNGSLACPRVRGIPRFPRHHL